MLLAWIHKRTTGTTNELKWLWEYFKISSAYDPQAICKWYCYSIPEGCSCPAGHTWESPRQWACLPLLWREEGARKAHPEAQRAMGTGLFLAPHGDRKGSEDSMWLISSAESLLDVTGNVLRLCLRPWHKSFVVPFHVLPAERAWCIGP